MTNFNENEEIQFELAVDLRKSIDYVNGILFITDQRFIFEPKNMHFRRDILEFNINDINDIDLSEVLGIVPNGITIELKDGTSNTFVLERYNMVECQDVMQAVRGLMKF